jgi:hypothetical protein
MNQEEENAKRELFKALAEQMALMEREIAKMLFLKHNPHVQIIENEKYEIIVCLN